MNACRVLVGSVLVSFCLTFDDARAQLIAELSDGIPADSFPTGLTTGPDTNLLADLIFNDAFDEQNGGTTCATATVLEGGLMYKGDTTAAPNWMSSFGPLFSPSNDVVYVFVAGPDVDGSIIPTASNYTFAMYLIPTCTDSGTEPSPIGGTATPGVGIDLLASGVITGNTYYLAITGTASGGPANGTVNFTTPLSLRSPSKVLRSSDRSREGVRNIGK